VHGAIVYDADRDERDTPDHNARAWSIIRETRLQCLPVVEDGKMLGIVSKFDFLRAFAFTSGQVVCQSSRPVSRIAAIQAKSKEFFDILSSRLAASRSSALVKNFG
jgi:signal-transduction protein with cAMP-binding, CBS, and nucleotidyltransferase domain